MKLFETIDSSIYKIGLCDLFALALHDLTELPLGGWAGIYIDDIDDEEATEFCHVVGVISFENKEWVDVDGYHKGEPKNCIFNNPDIIRLELLPLSREEASQVLSMCDIEKEYNQEYKKALKLIKNDPKLSRYLKKM